MSNNTFVDMVIQALVANVRKEHDAGHYMAAGQEASKGINGITQAKAEGQFAPALLKLYALRAHSCYMLASNSASARQRAQEDIENALTSLDVCGGLVAPEVASCLREDIRGLIGYDATACKASLEAVLNADIPCAASAPAVVSQQLAAHAVASPPLAASVGHSLKVYAIPFGVGLGLWAVAVFFFIIVSSSTDQSSYLLPGLSFFSLFMLAMRGWNWSPQYKFGIYGFRWKFVVMLFISGTFVGLIPIIYWTGKGTLRVLGIWET